MLLESEERQMQVDEVLGLLLVLGDQMLTLQIVNAVAAEDDDRKSRKNMN